MKFLLAILIATISLPLQAARPLTLEEAQQLAAQNNRVLIMARLKVQEASHKRAGARADYFPKALANANYLSFNEKLGSTITAGELGLGFLPPPFPSIPVPINLVKQNLFLGGVTVGQPLTQLIKIRQSVNAAASDEEIAKAQSATGRHEVRYAVEQLYYAVLITQRQRSAAAAKVPAAEELLQDARNAVETGNALPVSAIGRRVALLEAKQNLQAAVDLEADYSEALNIAIGLPPTTALSLTEPERPKFPLLTPEEAVRQALEHSPEVTEARARIDKARAGVRAAQADYIPEVTVVAQYFHQAGVPTLPGNFGAVGASATYTVFDAGKRRDLVRERKTLLAQAEENLKRVEDGLDQQVRKSLRTMDRSFQMVNVAREAIALRSEGERLAKDQYELGLGLKSAYTESQGARLAAEADLLRAEAGWRLGLAELRKQLGQADDSGGLAAPPGEARTIQ